MYPPVQPQSDPLAVYEERITSHMLKEDVAQRQVMLQLQALYHTLTAPAPATLWGKIRHPSGAAAKSIYIWGDVGRGKSLLMDIFYESITSIHKKRFHFHAFMQDVHTRMHAWHVGVSTKKHSAYDLRHGPLAYIAGEIKRDHGKLICLDELQVTDVADAMILGKLFTSMLEKGVTFVITSNRPPAELYKGGLQREKFLDFVKLIEAKMEVLELASPLDYRLAQMRALEKTYLCPLNKTSQVAFESAYNSFTHYCTPAPVLLEIQGRNLKIEQVCGGIARLQFAELCEKPLGAADYLAIAARFHTLFLSDIPQLGVDKRNEARRFITLIDTLYDHKVKLICTAAVLPDKLYIGHDGAFEFHRTASRLMEMQSAQYLALAHST